MASKQFKRKQPKNIRSSYNYKPRNPLKDEERAIYKRVALTFILILISVGVLYVWGTDILYGITNFWRDLVPGANIELSENKSSDENLIAPQLDPLIEFTNEDTLEVAGWAQSGNEVKILNNDEEVVVVLADKNGRYSYEITLAIGENAIKTIVINDSSESEPSSTQTVVYDTEKPELIVTIGNTNEEGFTAISGSTEVGALVYINNRRAIVGQDGTFNYEYKLEQGDNVLTITSEDNAGNIETVQDTRTYSAPEESDESAE